MLIIILADILLVYLFTIWTGSGNKLSTGITKTLRVVLFVLMPVLISLLVISHYNIYPRGYWVTKGIFWVVIFLMMILFGLGNKSVVSKIEEVVYGFIFYVPLCVIPFLLIPFLGIAFALVFYVSFIGDGSFIVYADENIRIQKQGIRFMGPDPPLGIYVKKGFFSHKDMDFPIGYNDKTDSLSVRKLNDSTYFLIQYAPDNYETPEGFKEFTFSIKPK